MTLVFERPNLGQVTIARGPESSLWEIAGAARQSMLKVDNINAAGRVAEEAFDNRIDAIFKATGVRLENPQRRMWQEAGGQDRFKKLMETERFHERLRELAEQFPDHQGAISPDRHISEDVKALAQGSEHGIKDVLSRRPGLAKYGALIVGGMAGMVEDPLNLYTMVATGGGKPAATLARAFARGAAINAGAEAVVQPFSQAWRAQVDLPHGPGHAALNIALAGLLGGGLEGGMRLAGGGVRKGAEKFQQRQAADEGGESMPAVQPSRELVAEVEKQLDNLPADHPIR